MINQELEKIKDRILMLYPNYNTGFANVKKPVGGEMILDDANNYRGISDQYGNYFYIRSLKESTWKARKYSSRPLMYDVDTQCRLVSIHHDIDEELHESIIVSTLSLLGHPVSKTITERTQVWKQEVNNVEINNWLDTVHLLSVDFTVSQLISAKICPPEICQCP